MKLVAAELGLSTALISMYLPYGKTVYDLEEKSGNARRVARWREKKAVDGDHPPTNRPMHHYYPVSISPKNEHRNRAN